MPSAECRVDSELCNTALKILAQDDDVESVSHGFEFGCAWHVSDKTSDLHILANIHVYDMLVTRSVV